MYIHHSQLATLAQWLRSTLQCLHNTLLCLGLYLVALVQGLRKHAAKMCPRDHLPGACTLASLNNGQWLIPGCLEGQYPTASERGLLCTQPAHVQSAQATAPVSALLAQMDSRSCQCEGQRRARAAASEERDVLPSTHAPTVNLGQWVCQFLA